MNQPNAEPAILYLDDQPSHLALFKKAFQGDYLVLTAGSGEQGLEIINDLDVFLIIADHNMPRMTGIDFLQKAAEVSPKSVQAILSAHLDDGIVREATGRGKAVGLLKKPWKLDGMRRFVAEAFHTYEKGLPLKTQDQASQPTRPIAPWQRPDLRWDRVVQFVHEVKEVAGKVDRQGAKRIFLRHVEPPIREYLPLIQRPAPEILQRAQEEALKGNFEALQKILSLYLWTEILPAEQGRPSLPH